MIRLQEFKSNFSPYLTLAEKKNFNTYCKTIGGRNQLCDIKTLHATILGGGGGGQKNRFFSAIISDSQSNAKPIFQLYDTMTHLSEVNDNNISKMSHSYLPKTFVCYTSLAAQKPVQCDIYQSYENQNKNHIFMENVTRIACRIVLQLCQGVKRKYTLMEKNIIKKEFYDAFEKLEEFNYTKLQELVYNSDNANDSNDDDDDDDNLYHEKIQLPHNKLTTFSWKYNKREQEITFEYNNSRSTNDKIKILISAFSDSTSKSTFVINEFNIKNPQHAFNYMVFFKLLVKQINWASNISNLNIVAGHQIAKYNNILITQTDTVNTADNLYSVFLRMRSGNVCASYPYQVGGFLPLLPENDVARRKIIKNLLLQIECFKLKNYLNILVGTTISIEPITTETIKSIIIELMKFKPIDNMKYVWYIDPKQNIQNKSVIKNQILVTEIQAASNNFNTFLQKLQMFINKNKTMSQTSSIIKQDSFMKAYLQKLQQYKILYTTPDAVIPSDARTVVTFNLSWATQTNQNLTTFKHKMSEKWFVQACQTKYTTTKSKPFGSISQCSKNAATRINNWNLHNTPIDVLGLQEAVEKYTKAFVAELTGYNSTEVLPLRKTNKVCIAYKVSQMGHPSIQMCGGQLGGVLRAWQAAYFPTNSTLVINWWGNHKHSNNFDLFIKALEMIETKLKPSFESITIKRCILMGDFNYTTKMERTNIFTIFEKKLTVNLANNSINMNSCCERKNHVSDFIFDSNTQSKCYGTMSSWDGIANNTTNTPNVLSGSDHDPIVSSTSKPIKYTS